MAIRRKNSNSLVAKHYHFIEILFLVPVIDMLCDWRRRRIKEAKKGGESGEE